MEGFGPPRAHRVPTLASDRKDNRRAFGWVVIAAMGALAGLVGTVHLLAVFVIHGLAVWAAQGQDVPPYPWHWLGWAALVGLVPAVGAALAFGVLGVSSWPRRIGLGLVVAASGMVLPWALTFVGLALNDVPGWLGLR